MNINKHENGTEPLTALAEKIMNKQGKMLIGNVCAAVMAVFEITGFCDILNIE